MNNPAGPIPATRAAGERDAVRARRVAAPHDAGEIALLDFGPEDRPVDIVFCHANGINAGAYRGALASAARDLRI